MQHSAVKNGDVLELALNGKFTFADNKVFTNVFDQITNRAFKGVEIDLSQVDFIDSAALGILLLIRDKCQRSEVALVLKNPKGQVRQMFEISRFNDLFKIEVAV